MRFRMIAAALLALLSSHASAFDKDKASRYPSPDLNNPTVNGLTAHGPITCAPGETCPASGLSVRPQGGLVDVPLSVLFGDAVPARTYGAVCDGTHDDTDALAKAAASGKRVIFPPGVCTTTAGITFVSGTKWNATVSRATEIRATAVISADQMIGGNNVSDVEVTGFNLNMQKGLFPSKQTTVLYFNNAYYGPAAGYRINVSNNYVPGATSGGITVDNTIDVKLNDNEVTDTYRDAIRCGTCKTVKALRNYVHDAPNMANGFRAIIIGSSQDVVANDNTIAALRKSDGGEGVFAFDFGGTVRFTIANNQMNDVESFLDLEQGSAFGNITGNTLVGKITSAATVNGAAKGLYCINMGCSHIRFSGNDISRVYNPVHIEGGYDYSIFGNLLHDFYGAGILASPVTPGSYINTGRPDGTVDAIVISGNSILNGGLYQAGSQSGINVRAYTGVAVGNFISGYAFAWDILDFNENPNFETAHNLMGDNGQSPDKFAGITNHRGRREMYGTGSPNGTVAGKPGDTYFNRQGGAGNTYWVKESGTDSSGWVAK